jgi:hypothetical protein
VGHGSTARELLLCGLHILEELHSLQERIILADVHEHRRASAVLRQHHRPPGALHPPHHGGEVRTEVSQGLDILSQARTGHASLAECVHNSVHIFVRRRKSIVAA